MVIFKSKLKNFFSSSFKFLDIVIFRIKKKKISININEIEYFSYELRDIKVLILREYLNKLSINRSYKRHLFNYLYISEPSIHKKASLLKYFLERKFDIKKISGSIISKKDIALFQKFGLKIEKRKINFKHFFIFFSMLLIIHRDIIERKKLAKIFSKESSRFNPKITYHKLLRAKVKNSEKKYLNKIHGSLDNTIIYIDPSLTSRTFRQLEYVNNLKKNNRNFFLYIPHINYFKVLIKAIKIYIHPFPKEFKVPLFAISLQRFEIDDRVKKVNKLFPDIQEFYLSAKSYQGTTYLTESLKDSMKKVIYFTQGVGVNCPLVNYDQYYVFSNLQEKYYIGNSKFKYFMPKIQLMLKQDYSKKQFGILFVCQNLFSYNIKSKMTDSYKDVINFVETIARDFNFPVYAKYHPGSSEKDKILSNKIKIIDNIEDLPPTNYYLAVTLCSAYVLDILEVMPFLIINPEKKLDLKYSFPYSEQFYVKDYNEFSKKLEMLKNDFNYYYEYWEKLIELINDKMR